MFYKKLRSEIQRLEQQVHELEERHSFDMRCVFDEMSRTKKLNKQIINGLIAMNRRKSMSRIELINDYYIEVEPLNYTLKQRYMGEDKEKNPKEQTRTIGYYGTVTHAVEEMIKHYCKNETKSFDGDLKAYAELIDNVGEKAVKALIGVLKGKQYE